MLQSFVNRKQKKHYIWVIQVSARSDYSKWHTFHKFEDIEMIHFKRKYARSAVKHLKSIDTWNYKFRIAKFVHSD